MFLNKFGFDSAGNFLLVTPQTPTPPENIARIAKRCPEDIAS